MFVDGTSGIVGFGTTTLELSELTVKNPTSSGNTALDIAGVQDETSYIVQRINSVTSGFGAQIHFSDSVNYNFAIGTDDTTTGDFTFNAGRFANNAGTEVMRIQQGGNVGIGTTSPDFLLHILETNLADDPLIKLERIQSTTRPNEIISRRARGSVSSPTSINAGDNIFSLKGVAFNGTANNTLNQINFGTDGGITGGDIEFFTKPVSGSLGLRMTIDNAGNVGIGTTSPSSLLDISGSNLTLTNETGTDYVYIKFSAGGFIYDNGTAIIIGHD